MIYDFEDKTPKLDANSWVAPNCLSNLISVVFDNLLGAWAIQLPYLPNSSLDR